MTNDKLSHIEKIMYDMLKKESINFYPQYKVRYTIPKYGTYLLDFALVEYKIDIECDGEFWHSLTSVKKNDEQRDKFLKSRGWRVLRFSGADLEYSKEKCLKKIRRCIDDSYKPKRMDM